MLLVSTAYLTKIKRLSFPIKFWLPWIFYIGIYLILDFSFLGLQLTLQYTLPILIGVVASGFNYNEGNLKLLFSRFLKLCGIIYLIFLASNFIGSGFTPNLAAMPMIFSLSISLFVGLFFLTSKWKFLLYTLIFFLAPIIEVTRMGIAAISAIIIFHFANQSIKSKLVFSGIGLLIFLIIFSSESFQEKTFYSGTGKISDITLDYYENPDLRSSGRISWKKLLEPGLEKEPLWGNGPRADNAYLTKITKMRGGEAHNDYLSVRFNYGFIGLILLMFGFAGTFMSLYIESRKFAENFLIWLLATSALTLFIPFMMFMYTDNILKYTIFFPNYFFAMIGIVYSLKRDEDLGSDTPLQ